MASTLVNVTPGGGMYATVMDTKAWGTTTAQQLNFKPDFVLPTGTGAGQMDLLFSDAGTLAAAGVVSYNLLDGSMLDPNRYSMIFARLKFIYVELAGAPLLTTLDVGAYAALTDPVVSWVLPVKNGSLLVPGQLHYLVPDATGYAVVNTTNHLLHILNAVAGSVTYNLIVVGATA